MRIILALAFLNIGVYSFAQNCKLKICNDDACGSVFVTYAPTGQNVFCEGSVITLENKSTTKDFRSFLIDWGDGKLDSVKNYNNILHTYDYSGIDRCKEGPIFNQTICYIGSKSCAEGESCNTSSTIISVRLRPVARFNVNSEVCVNAPLGLSETSCNVVANGYLWTFGDGKTSTDRIPNHSYTTPGNYKIKLRVTNSCGADSITKDIRVVAPPDAEFEHLPKFGCGETVIKFTNKSNEWSNTKWQITPTDTLGTYLVMVSAIAVKDNEAFKKAAD